MYTTFKAMQAVYPPEVMFNLLVACACEGEYVTCNIGDARPPVEDQPRAFLPSDLVGSWELRDEDDFDEDEQAEWERVKALDDVDLIVYVLEHKPSWGEFLGQVANVLYTWPPPIRDRIMPAFAKACEYAATNGVDH